MKKIIFLLGSLFVIAGISYAINEINEGWKVTKNTGSEMINAYSVCKFVTNNRTDYDIFVPTKTTAEWSAFRSNLPSNVSLSECGCFNDSDCSGGEVCVGVSGVCTGTATDPCDTVKTVGSIIGTPIKVTSCSFQSYYVDLNVLYNTSEIIMLDGVNSSSNYANSACSAYLSDTCKDLYYPGSALQGIYVESGTPDKRVTTSTCGSNKNIVSGKANTLALKNIRCYGGASSTSTCNTVSSLSECTSIPGCSLSIPGNCEMPGCRIDSDCPTGEECVGYASTWTCIGEQTNNGTCVPTIMPGTDCNTDPDEGNLCAGLNQTNCNNNSGPFCHNDKLQYCERISPSCSTITSQSTCSSTAGCSVNITSETMGTCEDPCGGGCSAISLNTLGGGLMHYIEGSNMGSLLGGQCSCIGQGQELYIYNVSSISNCNTASSSNWTVKAVCNGNNTRSFPQGDYTNTYNTPCIMNITDPNNTNVCELAICGNGTVEPGEVCDGGSTSCSVGGVSGTKHCNNTCNGWLSCSVSPCVVGTTGDPNTCAGCKGSWTMSSCVNRSCSVHGVDDAIWNCSYAGTTENCRSWQGYCDDDTCFVSGTKVTMADGSQKNIEKIEIGEKVLGQNNEINTVIEYDRPILGSRKLYSVNNGPYFVTHEHPFMTTQGWKSISPEATWREMPGFEILPLQIGDVLVKENGEFEYVYNIQSIESDSNTPLYNFKLDGNNTYYANGYLVHNKTACGVGGTCPTGYECVGSYCVPEAGGCFIEKTKITLGDGTLTNIENIKIGDIVLGSENTKNKVVQLYKLPNTHWKMYSINNSDYFVTDTHPFMTIDGWKSFNPLGTLKENPDMIVSRLEIGDVLITEEGTITLQNFDYKEWSGYVYNFKLDGNHTYYADGYLVHNPVVK